MTYQDVNLLKLQAFKSDCTVSIQLLCLKHLLTVQIEIQLIIMLKGTAISAD